MGNFIDLTGKKFGEWTVIEKAEKATSGNYKWLCRCSCGNLKKVDGNSLRGGRSTKCVSCVEPYSKTKYSGKPIQVILKGMKQRCYYKKHNKYKDYGGRGIGIHQEWIDNPVSFYDWAYDNGYKEGLSIERIDNNGNYEPSNCTFIEVNEQQQNKRKNNWITINGKTKILADWCKQFNINRNTVSSRVKRGMGYEEALTRSVNNK